jgi:MFS family permease
MALASPFAGRLSDRVEPRIIASLGMALTSLGLLALSFLRPWTPLPVVLLMLGGLGLGFGLFSSPNTNAVMGSVERRNFGVASATLGTMRLSGQMFNAGTTMMIFALFLGGARIVPELYPVFLKAMKTAFFLYACICFAGVFASLARGNRPVNG